MKPALQFLELALNNAENIFNPYIFKDKIDELLSEKRDLLKYINSYNKADFDESMVGYVDYENMNLEELTEYVDTLKKEVRRLKCDQRRILKAIDVLGKEKVEKTLNI